jgi:Fe2+ or Zn2+ uptake regulation protein
VNELPTDELLVEAVRRRGGRVTPQRRAILRYLAEERRHVTAEDVLAAMGERIPGVSLPTVYATLELLEELELVRRVATGGGVLVFDSRTEPHHHAVCRGCGRLEDVEADVDASAAVAAASAHGFLPETASVNVTGLCARCAEQGREDAPAGRPSPAIGGSSRRSPSPT